MTFGHFSGKITNRGSEKKIPAHLTSPNSERNEFLH